MHPLRSLPLFLLPLALLLSACSGERHSPESPTRGVMRLAVDPGYEGPAATEAGLFSRYYPEARASVVTAESLSAPAMLARGECDAALSLLRPDVAPETKGSRFRVEPVGRDAVVCLVNAHSPLRRLSVSELKALFGGERSGVLPLIAEGDVVMRALLEGGGAHGGWRLRAYGAPDRAALLRRIEADAGAAGLMLRSAYLSAKESGLVGSGVRMLPISADGDTGGPRMPDAENILEGSYPFVVEVWYIYIPGDALPAGFGSWFSGQGQKALEHGPLVPWRRLERTIILSAQPSSDPL
ncbi:substrate-binding domain-containing protein [Chlorobium sp. N1]|uniref:substrate-binding domain-containing protein n=1 Tax=Chlorobium sp. N1 TaxID=2491138 RepID=UPI00103DB415|nr:substrate-binding domain-containing protein [Chlorobium sp. N1]TCD47389.1 hypothetical protein E0L29_07520 [Chlorobium sp. N1]